MVFPPLSCPKTLEELAFSPNGPTGLQPLKALSPALSRLQAQPSRLDQAETDLQPHLGVYFHLMTIPLVCGMKKLSWFQAPEIGGLVNIYERGRGGEEAVPIGSVPSKHRPNSLLALPPAFVVSPSSNDV